MAGVVRVAEDYILSFVAGLLNKSLSCYSWCPCSMKICLCYHEINKQMNEPTNTFLQQQ